ncbi:MAG: hypothetical protein NTV08_15620 [Verrucomicrobia bacterium]|nr:hypothetical protein [Verrucomicrobiota bacterium]
MENGTAAERTFPRGLGLGTHSRVSYALPVWRVRELSFDIEARGKSAPGKNHAVIAEPLLFKAKPPPAPDIPGVR